MGARATPGTNTYTATFEVYVVNTDDGLEVPRSSSGPFSLNWTDVPDGRPQLNIAAPAPGQVQLIWPASATNWTLVSAATLGATNWSAVSNAPVTLSNRCAVTLNAAAAPFYRLKLNR